MIFNIFVIVKIFIGILLIMFLFDMDFGFFKNWIFLFFVVLLRLIYLCKYFLSLEYVLIFVVVLKIIGRSKIVLLDNLNYMKVVFINEVKDIFFVIVVLFRVFIKVVFLVNV